MSDSQPGNAIGLPPSTAPEEIPVNLRNFEDEEYARQFGILIGDFVRQIGRAIDIDRLDGITVAYNYDEALAQLDRGYEATRPLTRTSEPHNAGVAMAPTVLRDGVVKAHLVFSALYVLPLEDSSSEGFHQALYLVAYECAHIEDLKQRDVCFPEIILKLAITDPREAVLEQATHCWEEYAACRISSSFGDGEIGRFEESFLGNISSVRERTESAILEYRFHGDVDRVLEEAGGPLFQLLRSAAYLWGHLDGREEGLDQAPAAHDALCGSEYATFVARLLETLRALWARRGEWQSRGEFSPIKELAADLLAYGGLQLKSLPDGRLWVGVP